MQLKTSLSPGFSKSIGSVQFSHSVVSDSLRPHEPQHARPPCPSPTPRVHPNSCLLSQWCHPTISSSVVPFSSCLQSFPTSGSFQMSQLFTSGGQSIGVSASTSSNENWGLISFSMDWLDLLAVQGTLKSLLQHHSSKASLLWNSAFYIVQLSHPHIATGKTIALTRRTFVGKVMSLLFNMLSRLVITFLPRSKRLLIYTYTWFIFIIIINWEQFQHIRITIWVYVCNKLGNNINTWNVSNSSYHHYHQFVL